jgi:FKBP-type peptidyl-prolyl cis-trans isomerase
MVIRGSPVVLASLFIVALLCSPLNAKGDSEKPAKKKGDMTAYQKRVAAKFIAETAKKEGVQLKRILHFQTAQFNFLFGAGIYELQSGMLVEILKEGTKKKAKSPKAGDSCKVTYSGTLKDGTPFDSGTTSFAPNQVIKGWTEGVCNSILSQDILTPCLKRC